MESPEFVAYSINDCKMAPKEKVSRKPYLQIRCTVRPMLETMQIVKESHLKLLQRTPFWPLLEVFHYGTISKSHCEDFRTPTLDIIQIFNPETTCFHFGTRDVSMNTEDISQILGLPQHGEAVQFCSIRLYKSDFTERHFKGIDSCKLNHKCIHDLLIELLNGKEQTDIEDVVRLTLMELFVTFLFAGSSISFALMKYCDEFDKLSRYSWAEAVGGFLNKSLRTKSKLKRDGCVLLIPFWLCEKTNITQPISGREIVEGHKPSLIKWSLPELNRKMQRTTIREIECLFKQQSVGVETDYEHEKQEQEEGEEGQEELKKKDMKEKKRELNQQLRKELEERRKLPNDCELLDLKSKLEDNLKPEMDKNMELIKKDQLNPESCSTAIQSSPRDDIEVSRIGHQTSPPTKGSGVRVKKQQLDPDFVCDVVPKKKKAKKQHTPSDTILTLPSRAIQDPAGQGDESIIIIDVDSVSEEENSPRKACFPFERCEVFKLMDDEYQQKVKTFWNMANPKELFWVGNNANITREDVKKLIKDTAVASNVIDAFMELLEQQQHHQNSVKISTYISTLCWNFVGLKDARKKGKKGKKAQVQDEVHDEVGLHHLVFDPLLGSMAHSDFVFFPIISKFHYTLLVLNKHEKKWTHYNPLRKRSELHIDPCYEIAKQMHQLIQNWLLTTQKEAQQALLKGTKQKKTCRKEESGAAVLLNEDEKRTLTWMMDNSIDFKIENDRICPQQDFKSLDCGIFVMYYMNQLSKGLQLEEEITECRMWEFRKHIIQLFLDHENSRKHNSTT